LSLRLCAHRILTRFSTHTPDEPPIANGSEFSHPLDFPSLTVGHPLLDSFPTRRSSDLLVFHHPLEGVPRVRKRRPVRDGRAGVRSEEHTAERQSHLKFLCRLLLEKKKTFGAIVLSVWGCGRLLDRSNLAGNRWSSAWGR